MKKKSTRATTNKLKYLAGFIDGDGTITLNKRGKNRYRAALIVYNCDVKIVKLLDETFGKGNVRVKLTGTGKLKNMENWRPCIEWRILDNKAIDAIKLIYPFLRLKINQAKLILKFNKIRNSASSGARRHNKELNNSIKIKFKKIKNKIMQLNKRGTLNKSIIKINKSPLSLQYIAGFIDAEGYIGIVKVRNNNSFKPKISITNTNKDIIKLLQNKLGGYIGTKIRFNKKWKTAYDLTIAYNMAVDIIKKIQPFLILKLEQSKLCVAWLKYSKYNFTRDQKLKTIIYENRNKLYLKSLDLNKRGK